jgi:ATP-dependent RNA helicase RhlB
MKFRETPFDERILRAVDELGFETCTPVQEETFRLVLEGRDVMAQSQTGTGKTAAFLVSGFHLLLHDPNLMGKKMLVLAPTRELADQIEKEAQLIGKHLSLRIGSFYGGVGYGLQEKKLLEGVDVLLGTPGRILDFVQSKKLNLKEVGIIVVDEADRMFDMGFLPDIKKILKGLNPPTQRRTFLFSATLNSQVGYLAWEFMNNPAEVLIEPEQVSVQNINQELYHVSLEEKMITLLGVLKKYQPRNAVFFVNTKQSAIKLANRLKANGYAADFLIGDMPQTLRLKVIENFKDGKLSWLVATDVAARGLHIEDLDLVVNYDLPLEAETYVHRIGRTARAGKSGRAVSLACEKYVYGLKAIEDFIGFKLPVQWLDESLLVEDKSLQLQEQEERRPDHSVSSRGGRQGRHNTSSVHRGQKNVARLVAQIAGTKKNHPESESSIPEKKKLEKGPKVSHQKLPGVTTTLEDKLAYYKKKYGAEFQKAKEEDQKPGSTDSTASTKKTDMKKRSKRSDRRKRTLRETSQLQEQSSMVPQSNRTDNEQSSKSKGGLLSQIFGFFFSKKKE